jgi:hypothetical protein
MERDFRKLTAWIEETLQASVPEETKVLEWKRTEKSQSEHSQLESSEPAKAR